MTESPSRPNPEAPETNGSYIMGIIGAFAGALVGALPWVFLSISKLYFIGWLGLLSGWLSCWGYRKLGGRRAARFATATVILSTVIALEVVSFSAIMYNLCTDPGWKADAASHGVSVYSLALKSLLTAENLSQVTPLMITSLIAGLVSALAARGQLLQYANPKAAQKERAQAQAAEFDVMEPLEELPQEFTLREPKSSAVVSWIFTLFFLTLAVVSLFFIDWREDIWVVAGFMFFSLLGVYLLLRYYKCRLTVNGESLHYVSPFGKSKKFIVYHIERASVPGRNSTAKLYAVDGKVLAKFERSMNNYYLMLQYLEKYNVPIK